MNSNMDGVITDTKDIKDIAYIIASVTEKLKQTYITETSVISTSNYTKIDFDLNSVSPIPVSYEITEFASETLMHGINKLLLGANYTNKGFRLSVYITDKLMYTTEHKIMDYEYGTNEEIEARIKKILNRIGESYKKYCSYLIVNLYKNVSKLQPEKRRRIAGGSI